LSQRAFQATLARLVIDPNFRARVRESGEVSDVDSDDLTALEHKRLLSIVSGRGMDATRMLHKSFRLTKLYTMLPLTRTLLGHRRLAREISDFWAESLPVSHYFLEECIAFCVYLQRREREGLRVKYLAEVVAYERANLELRRPRVGGQTPPPQTVSFRHDPTALLACLLNERRPRALPVRPCTLVGATDDEGNVEWRTLEESATATERKLARV
jgi:hypothetical protein